MQTPGQGGEADNNILTAYGRNVLNQNGKLLLDFAENDELTHLNTFCCTPRSSVSYTFQNANRRKGQACLDYILAKQADRQLVCCVSVCRPPSEVPYSDHNVVYAKVRIPRRSAPSLRKRSSTKKTPKTADLRRLMAGIKKNCLACRRTNIILNRISKAPKRSWWEKHGPLRCIV